MAKKNVKQANAVREASTVKKGFKRIEATDAPFWAPHDSDQEHPNPLEGIVVDQRELPARGKFPAQKVIDLQTDEGQFTVPLRGNLKRLVKSAMLGVGQTVRIEYLGKEDPSDDVPMGMNHFTLDVQE